MCAGGVRVEGSEDAVHVATAVIHLHKREIQVSGQPVLVHDEGTGGLQHWDYLRQRHLVAVVLRQDHCRCDAARGVGIAEVAHRLRTQRHSNSEYRSSRPGTRLQNNLAVQQSAPWHTDIRPVLQRILRVL